jgi:hypothetical protein
MVGLIYSNIPFDCLLFLLQSTLEAVKDNHQRRMAKLEEMIEDRRMLVEDHESGRRKLNEEEFDRASRQFRNFNRKLEHMRSHNNDVSLRVAREIMN